MNFVFGMLHCDEVLVWEGRRGGCVWSMLCHVGSRRSWYE